MKFKSIIALSAAIAVIATGCNKKLAPLSADQFSVNPSPLEVVGQKVPATVTASIPAKYFQKNAELTVTPYLEYEGIRVASEPFQMQGEKVRGNNTVVSFDNGGVVSFPVSYAYDPDMRRSVLVLDFAAKQGNKQYVLPQVRVAEGLVATPALADASKVAPAIGADRFQRIINEKYNAQIRFLINQAKVRKGETESKEMADFNAELLRASRDSSRQIEGINIESYASPEGNLDFNTRLAENREKSTSEYLRGQLRKDNVTEFGELTADFTAEDWEGFQQMVAASDIQDKDLILSVLSMYKDPEIREREIRNLSSVFDQLADKILPQLRRSRITASVNVIGKSDDQIRALFISDPSKLSVDELLYCATLTDSPAERLAVYQKTAELYPNDYRAINNVGACIFEQGDFNAAEAAFQKAEAVKSSPEAQMNLGLIDLVNGNYSSANQRLGNAAGAQGVGDALGVYFLSQGDYLSAMHAFGDSKTNNAALSQILTKDYSKASATLNSVAKPDAMTSYLKAIVAARTNNDAAVTENLDQAIRLDKTLVYKALTDIEFAHYLPELQNHYSR
ncbi:MAG: hypothetical protein II752_07930 [Muribaculaceae bacterium]|nr:hypothetical protein [Muribaculaceae bacterium]